MVQGKQDPVDSVLESLGGRSWPGDYDNDKLKERIMQDFQTNSSVSRLGRRGALAATLAIAILGTAGFAAAGGLDLVRTWFVTAEVNGEPVDLSGADITVEEDGNTATITVDNIQGDLKEGDVVTITATSGPDGTIMSADTSTRGAVKIGDSAGKSEQPPNDE